MGRVEKKGKRNTEGKQEVAGSPSSWSSSGESSCDLLSQGPGEHDSSGSGARLGLRWVPKSYRNTTALGVVPRGQLGSWTAAFPDQLLIKCKGDQGFFSVQHPSRSVVAAS